MSQKRAAQRLFTAATTKASLMLEAALAGQSKSNSAEQNIRLVKNLEKHGIELLAIVNALKRRYKK